jgi:NAD(P)-dependent dehydrogenase (short-subunit alcohol dehydrogenase family)
VLVTDIDGDSARQTAESIGESAWSMVQDVRDPDSHRAVATAAAERGRLALWVNNAGVLKTGVAWDIDDDTVRRHVEVNFLGVVWGSRAAVDAMRDGGGHIINIGSMSSIVPAPGLAVYGATKHAVLGFSSSLAGDLAHAGLPIELSVVCPDAIETDMVRDNAHDDAAGLLFSSGRLLSPEKVSDLVVDLIDKPRLVVTYPPSRAALAHALRPFPAFGLRLLEGFRKLGERNRRRRQSQGT